MFGISEILPYFLANFTITYAFRGHLRFCQGMSTQVIKSCFCRAQSKFQLNFSWTEFSLILSFSSHPPSHLATQPPGHPATHPVTQNSTEITGYRHYEIKLNIQMEEDLNER